jgi:hypothetical protein
LQSRREGKELAKKPNQQKAIIIIERKSLRYVPAKHVDLGAGPDSASSLAVDLKSDPSTDSLAANVFPACRAFMMGMLRDLTP